MKPSIAIYLMICLQVAMSPLCLCFGAEVEEEVAPMTCCHAPEGTEPAPCPHCDQELPLATTAPVKGEFDADPPEWCGPELFFSAHLFEVNSLSFPNEVHHRTSVDVRLPSRNSPALLGVFLI